ncbi:hypothetical protein HELRODRAFT_179650 [Helobdella robusta]|uniref:Uncharacterized protein n=1 Tax=Helobdella robusta TaxID=6412 RepID=T1FEZ7_HELRO|nr:hypothetical protein HELRODRAFT_179650 [Helobdella robusta]ESN95302.1 hypothetical protein HELRODRAFT_179650 [Helobdella robusta]
MGNTHDTQIARIEADFIGSRWKTVDDYRWGYCKDRANADAKQNCSQKYNVLQMRVNVKEIVKTKSTYICTQISTRVHLHDCKICQNCIQIRALNSCHKISRR